MPSAPQVRYSLAEELDGEEPGVTAEGAVLSAAGAKAVVDLGDVGRDVLNAREVEAVDPQTRVVALHMALEIVEGPCCMLQAGGLKHLEFTSFKDEFLLLPE